MEYYSEQDFRKDAMWFSFAEHISPDKSAVNTPLSTYYDVFLSYNIEDLEVVKGIYYALGREGLKVYLDVVVDPALDRNSTDKRTAEIIHTRLEHSKSIIYAESPNARRSNWMPWEIGVVDGRKGKCMVMPISNDKGEIPTKREYLLLYPTIHPSGKNKVPQVIQEGNNHRIISSTMLSSFI